MSTKTSSLEDHLGYWLRMLSNEVSACFAAKLESHGVTVAQWVVLRILFDQKNATVVEVAATLDIDKGAVSRMIDRTSIRSRSAGDRSRSGLEMLPSP